MRVRANSSIAVNLTRQPRALVYCGEGAGQRSVLTTVQSLTRSLSPSVLVTPLNTAKLLAGGWQEGCVLLCMPGGADLPYCRDLNGRGNKLIRAYVEAGGAYLGLCAGAYYACCRIEFEPGSRLEVTGNRELAFFPGVARGSVYRGFQYATEAGTHAAPLRFKRTAQPCALVQLASNGHSVISVDDEQWAECEDYSNGGPAFFPDEHSCKAFSVLATYRQPGLGIAAVSCRVGEGMAVLCGTHPELDPHWLDAACDARIIRDAAPGLSEKCVNQLTDRAKAVQMRLQESNAARLEFWNMLLHELGLGKYVKHK